MIKSGKLGRSRRLRRRRRHVRIRKKVHGTGDRPRLVVHRSLRNIEGQVVDDDAGRTMVGFSTLSPAFREAASADGDESGGKVGAARAAGKMLAEQARERGVVRVVFDRGGFHYHGRVKAFAEGAREGGLEF